ncbi:MAG: hypothetical protein HYY13_11565 [Nitrospirae bacterium]|nr:hypothetical protein [Nitrospirota bacterium]
MTPLHFCTLFDGPYLARGLVLYNSLCAHAKPFHLWIWCLDDAVKDVLARLNLPDVTLLTTPDLEGREPRLAVARSNRATLEYYFTCKSVLVSSLLGRVPSGQTLTFLDADLCYFSRPEPLYNELGSGSVGMFGHRYPPGRPEVTGKYNAGWCTFRNDKIGRLCAEWWMERCLEWCYARVEERRWGDQKYLEEWPQRFGNVVVLTHKGGNTAPWNLCNWAVRLEGGEVWIDEVPLVFFHFHHVRALGLGLYDPNLEPYGVVPTRAVIKGIYSPYLRALHTAVRLVRRMGSEARLASRAWRDLPSDGDGAHAPVPGGFRRHLGRAVRTAEAVIARRYLLTLGGRVLA